jgi:hypothetical protein
MLPGDSIWYQDISGAPVDPESATVIGGLAIRGGWGLGGWRSTSTSRC